ncbi:MAG TPA: hypothetical protein DDY91_08500 [Planctomycetaceae bacterium]|nr:hypothetical protein [Planctomycetaceae bacterium]
MDASSPPTNSVVRKLPVAAWGRPLRMSGCFFMTALTDAELDLLFAAALAQDRDATNRFFLYQHQHDWLPYVRRRWPSRLWARESGEDVLQAAEMTICTTFRQFTGDLEHWRRLAKTILTHELIERIRYWDAQCRQTERTVSAERPCDDLPGLAESFVAPERTPSSNVARSELRHEIEEYLAELTAEEWLAFHLRDEGKSWAEIGERLGMSADGARKVNSRREERARDDRDRFLKFQ